MTITYFITGTDTNIGKTTCALQLMKFYQAQGHTVLGLKPMATGAEYRENFAYNNDALLLQQASNLKPNYKHVNPYLFDDPVSPHIVNIDNILAKTIADSCKQAIALYQPDYCLIEGAGGWLCPLNQSQSFADIVTELSDHDIAVILVVGIKLGCLNHAMLTAQAIRASGLQLYGWIANHLQTEDELTKANVKYLQDNINAQLRLEVLYMDQHV